MRNAGLCTDWFLCRAGNDVAAAIPALERLGAKGPFDPGYHGSFAFSGSTGTPKVWSKTEVRPRYHGPAILVQLIPTPAAQQGQSIMRYSGSSPERSGDCWKSGRPSGADVSPVDLALPHVGTRTKRWRVITKKKFRKSPEEWSTGKIWRKKKKEEEFRRLLHLRLAFHWNNFLDRAFHFLDWRTTI